jgi:acyl-CoA thioesterase-1
MFARSDRVPKLIASTHPDLVLITLGANDVYEKNPAYLAKTVERIARMTEGRDCIWIGPPIWKAEYAPLVELLREHAAPCAFFESTGIAMERKAD